MEQHLWDWGFATGQPWNEARFSKEVLFFKWKVVCLLSFQLLELYSCIQILFQELGILKNEQFKARAECAPIEKAIKLNLKRMEPVNQLENAMHCQHDAFAKCKGLKQIARGKGLIFFSQKMLLGTQID